MAAAGGTAATGLASTRSDAIKDTSPAAAAGNGTATGIVDLDREFIEVLSRARTESRFPDGARREADRVADPVSRPGDSDADREAEGEAARQQARTLVSEGRPEAADVVPLLVQTQQLLAKQQVQLAEALRTVYEQAAEQRAVATEQARIAEELTTLRRQLAKQRKIQRSAAHYIATHGRHRGE